MCRSTFINGVASILRNRKNHFELSSCLFVPIHQTQSSFILLFTSGDLPRGIQKPERVIWTRGSLSIKKVHYPQNASRIAIWMVWTLWCHTVAVAPSFIILVKVWLSMPTAYGWEYVVLGKTYKVTLHEETQKCFDAWKQSLVIEAHGVQRALVARTNC